MRETMPNSEPRKREGDVWNRRLTIEEGPERQELREAKKETVEELKRTFDQMAALVQNSKLPEIFKKQITEDFGKIREPYDRILDAADLRPVRAEAFREQDLNKARRKALNDY